MSPLKGVRVIEAANSLVVPRGGRGGEERAWPLSFSFFQMKNFWSSVSRQRRRTEHYFKRVQTISCALRGNQEAYRGNQDTQRTLYLYRKEKGKRRRVRESFHRAWQGLSGWCLTWIKNTRNARLIEAGRGGPKPPNVTGLKTENGASLLRIMNFYAGLYFDRLLKNTLLDFF